MDSQNLAHSTALRTCFGGGIDEKVETAYEVVPVSSRINLKKAYAELIGTGPEITQRLQQLKLPTAALFRPDSGHR
jgi:hypothetical protein